MGAGSIIHDVFFPAVILGLLSLMYFSGIDWVRQEIKKRYRNAHPKSRKLIFNKGRWYARHRYFFLISGVCNSCLFSFLILFDEKFTVDWVMITLLYLGFTLLQIIVNAIIILSRTYPKLRIIPVVISTFPITGLFVFLLHII